MGLPQASQGLDNSTFTVNHFSAKKVCEDLVSPQKTGWEITGNVNGEIRFAGESKPRNNEAADNLKTLFSEAQNATTAVIA